MDVQHDASPVTPTPHQRPSAVDRPFSLQPPGPGSSHHYRFADFDDETFAEQSGISAEQAKRALRAHLAETERRMAEAGRLGTALVQQQKELTDKLREVEDLQAESELSPDLKKKLSELEKEYDDVARETARAFLPKQRIPSNESAGSPEPRSGRRSISPVKYESHASGSPSKLTVSNRKQRNQANNRVHDIEFAAEISTSLISQVRGLQALLAERDEELRDTKQELSQLEDTSEGLRERIKELDESEHRFKEENWNLETRVHDLDAAQREAADKEKKVAQQLAALQAEKNKSQRDLDELRGTHARLVDDHTAAVKLHDIELGTAKRNIVLADGEKTALQRKIDDLASQNQELARAVSLQYRSRSRAGEAASINSEDELDSGGEQVTPEHSPPASPVKGTPRHSVLESETLKTSLLHAQRTLQSLRTNLHREKTEKLELRRMLQDTRDDLERARADPNSSSLSTSRRNRKEARESQKLRSSQLGGARSSRTDLYMLASADPDWEEVHGELSPSAARARSGYTESDQFETANEARVSDTEYTTANDGAETEEFQTVAEDFSSDEDTITETEQDTTLRRVGLRSRGGMSARSARSAGDEDQDPAEQSTASTSDDEAYVSPRTPTASLPSSGASSRMRLRVSRSSLASRRLRHMSSIEDVGSSPIGLQSSPFSAIGSPAGAGLPGSSANSTPRAPGQQQSLFAELGELGEESDEELGSDGTPGRSLRSLSPSGTAIPSRTREFSPLARIITTPKAAMVDSETLTDAVNILPWSDEEKGPQHLRVLATESRPTSFVSDTGSADVDMGEKLKEFPSPPTTAPGRGLALAPIMPPPPEPRGTAVAGKDASEGTREVEAIPVPPPQFTISDVVAVPIAPVTEPVVEPVVEPPTPPVLAFSSLLAEHVTPKASPVPEPAPLPVFATSSLRAVDITPIELPPPVVPVPVPKALPTFSLSSVQVQHVVPIAPPEPVPAPVEPLSFSTMQVQHVQPIPEPEKPVIPPPQFSLSTMQTEEVQPRAPPEKPPVPPPQFSVSALQAEQLEPRAAPEKVVPPPRFSLSSMQIEEVEPRATPKEVVPPLQFSLSSLQIEQVEPKASPRAVVPPPHFSMSALQAEQFEPRASPKSPIPPPHFSLSPMQTEQVEPKTFPKAPIPPPQFSLSAMQTEECEPRTLPPPQFSLSGLQAEECEPRILPPPQFSLSGLQAEQLEPRAVPEKVVPPPQFSFSSMQIEQVEPRAAPEKVVPPPQFSLSTVQAEQVELRATPKKIIPPPQFSLSGLQAEECEPRVLPPPQFSLSSLQAEQLEPRAVPEKVVPPPQFSFSAMQMEQVEPRATPKKVVPPPQFSLSSVQIEQVEPRATPEEPLPPMALSHVFSQDVEPVVVEEEIKEQPVIPIAPPTTSSSTGTQTDEWKPQPLLGAADALGGAAAALGAAISSRGASGVLDTSGSRSPKRNAIFIPRDDEIEAVEDLPPSQRPFTPSKSGLDTIVDSWSKAKGSPTTVIAEDETRQSPSTSPLAETPESQRPFKEISVNANASRQVADDQNTMRSLASADSSAVDDEAFDTTPRAAMKPSKTTAIGVPGWHVRADSQESTGSVRRIRPDDVAHAEHRPASDISMPPLPANHKEAIEAARTGAATATIPEVNLTTATAAIDPTIRRVRTPTTGASKATATTTTRGGTAAVVAEARPSSRPTSRTNASNAGGSVVRVPGTISRQTSMSSFASEVDARFNIHDGSDVFGNGVHTDPRMIQAITQTMIGEYLWKYTRKPGRSGLSENRHRRYFWIHPYTRMLYWSNEGPTNSRAEQRAKSVVIEGVRVVTDDNPMPPGLHRKSLVVISPGRTIKFTCTTGHRHEIWFNALSYLLLRNEEAAEDDGMMANGDRITREDVDEFNPSFGTRAAPPQARRRPPVSLSSYNSRTTRTDSPAFDVSMNIPTLAPTPKKNVTGAAGATGSAVTPLDTAGGHTARGRLSRIGGYWRSSQSLSAQFNSIRSHRHNAAHEGSIYEASEVNDSAEELRVLYEAQDRDSSRLENVRACCDGKHDVGTLSRSSRRHRHSHPATSAMSTPTHGTARHRP